MRSSHRRLAWLSVALLAACLAGGCGGDDESSTTQWAGDVCSAITSWTESITSTAASLGGGNLSEDTLKSAADDVRGLGPPDTEAGEEAKESLDQLADATDESLSAIRTAVDDVSGIGDVVEAVTAVSAAISTMGAQLQSTFAAIQKLDAGGELEAAFKEADSCNELESR